MRVRLALFGVAVCLCLTLVLSAQDAAKVDAKHYTVVKENDEVRIVRVHYGPHEKSVMHSHPASVAVFLTDGMIHFTLPGGKTVDEKVKAGDTRYVPAQTHLPENLTDKPTDLILVELKCKGASKVASAMPATIADNK